MPAPDISHENVRAFLQAQGITEPATPYLCGRRGYYRDSMGVVGKNDVGMYDDAIVLVTPTAVRCYQANTDPSRVYPGVATLCPGSWWYQLGTHGLSHPPGPRRYEALVQAGVVRVRRAGGADQWGLFGINIHHGAEGSTSSEGCQTIPPESWADFLASVKAALAPTGATHLRYVLTERPDA